MDDLTALLEKLQGLEARLVILEKFAASLEVEIVEVDPIEMSFRQAQAKVRDS